MIQINGKTYRNLQEQVQKNKEDIEELKGGGSAERSYEFTDIETVTYDSTDGAKIYGKLHTITDDDEVVSDATVDLPILPGTNITIDASETDDSLVIKNDIDTSTFVTKTDYATTSAAGIVKLDPAVGLEAAPYGTFGAGTITNIDSPVIANNAFIGKGTLLNKLTQYAKTDLIADDDTLGLVKTDSYNNAISTSSTGVLQAGYIRPSDYSSYPNTAFISKLTLDGRFSTLNIDDVTDETWTFTLADNTTVTKTVKVGS